VLDRKLYNEILDSGLILDHYLLLCDIKDGNSISDNKRVKGFINLLEKRGYLSNGIITELGKNVIKSGKIFEKVESKVEVTTEVQNSTAYKYKTMTEFYETTYLDCQKKIKELTGDIQKKPKINGKTYSFLPNKLDFIKVLGKAIFIYKLKDYELIRKTLLGYIDRCHTSSNWFPLMQYYILKFSASQMVTDMDNFKDVANKDEQFTIKKNNEMF
jgi:hypothetical protein